MGRISWVNNSSQDIKWMAYVNGQWEGNMLSPQQSYAMDDDGVEAAGWLLSGFNGVTYRAIPSSYTAFNVALDDLIEGEKPLTELPEAE